MWLYSIAIKRTGDTEKDPVSKPNSYDSLFIWHWNLHSISSHKFIKLSVPRT